MLSKMEVQCSEFGANNLVCGAVFEYDVGLTFELATGECGAAG